MMPNAVKLLITGVTCHVSRHFQEKNHPHIFALPQFYSKRPQEDQEASMLPKAHTIVPDCTLCELMVSPVFFLLGPCVRTLRLDDGLLSVE